MQANSLKAWNAEYRNKGNVWRERNSRVFPESVFSKKKVLELGVGDGKTLRQILAQEPREVNAVDFSPISIRHCVEKFKSENAVGFFCANACELPFKNAEFNVVVCFHTLAHLLLEERLLAVKEIFRVLKTQGTVWFEDFAIGDFRFGKGKELEQNTFQRGNGITYHYFSVDEINELFHSAGFSGKAELVEKELSLAGKRIKRKEIKGVFQKNSGVETSNSI